MATFKQYNLCGHIASKPKGNTDGVEEYERSPTTVLRMLLENENKKLVLHSYVVKTKSTGLRKVLLLYSMQPLLGTTKDDGKKKPAIYKLYNLTKGGTDVMDQQMATFSCKTKSN